MSTHNANMSMQYTVIFHGCKNDNFQLSNCNSFQLFFCFFAQNIDYEHTLLTEAVLTSTHNLCFRAKIRI